MSSQDPVRTHKSFSCHAKPSKTTSFGLKAVHFEFSLSHSHTLHLNPPSQAWKVLNDAQQQLQTPEIQLTLNLLRARFPDQWLGSVMLLLWLALATSQGARRFLATMHRP